MISGLRTIRRSSEHCQPWFRHLALPQRDKRDLIQIDALGFLADTPLPGRSASPSRKAKNSAPAGASLTTRNDRLKLYASTILSQWLAAAIILWRGTAHGMTLAQLGLAVPKTALTFFVSAVLTGLIAANQFLSIREFAKNPSQERGILPQLAARIFPQDNFERAVFIPLVLTVAFCEELIYRGFVQALFRDAFRCRLRSHRHHRICPAFRHRAPVSRPPRHSFYLHCGSRFFRHSCLDRKLGARNRLTRCRGRNCWASDTKEVTPEFVLQVETNLHSSDF